LGIYANTIFFVFVFEQNLDELHAIVRELCGEVPLEGHKELKDTFDKEWASGRLGV
jgi:hypothetical protein